MANQAKEKKYVYFFGGKKAEGKADMKNLLGGKGANLAEMGNTVLNVGLNDITREGLIRKTKNPRFVYDSQRRLIQMYSDVVM